MLENKKYDFIVIGAGIIGLSIVKELTERFPKAKIALLEKENDIGYHASGRNSGVLHSGIYYPKDSLKSSVCANGGKRLYHFAKEHHIPCKKLGKVIIATHEREIPTLKTLLKNAKLNQINAELLNTQEIKKIEPYASPYELGIYIPDAANIDSKSVLKTLKKIIQDRGVKFYFNNEIIKFDKKNKTLISTQQKFNYAYLFNCAGTGTDTIAKMFGLAQNYRLLPFKGIYYELKKENQYLVNGNIYPVPDLNLPFLGVHFTRSIHGNVYVGPTAIPAFGRENYGIFQGMDFEAFRIMKDIFSMYCKNHQNFRMLIHSEMKKYLKSHFVANAKKLVPSIHSNHLTSSQKVGIRPQLINIHKKKIELDYIIEKTENSTHILNAISPAFTSAFSFAEWVVNSMEDKVC